MAHITKRIVYVAFLAGVFCVSRADTSLGTMQEILGVASWYAEFSPGIRETTANMETFDHNAMTCAIWDFPFDTFLEVTNLGNGEKVRVRVNDRGPAKRLCRKGRVIDLTMASFKKIADLAEGLVDVEVRIVE
ncbi:MAG: septal ring lytic transglycosylase RlpA family protein [Candidatus Omnitrophica bacterium]|nr:septal ring lytic transglycosylase RlpA family protein [Candidatus Omnitrophota bacterium]MBU1128918.1 septal ring lytic transglycosylase RlpA family protein [Candidatus Omnitrophota bacterium]MBU1784920.1 septal ring lytic transglycosylase RlpA family protein [Candidatus Omnitrophota bacterium]MBU1852092.1 septal ring lytic transglycosylase RlpA family protein [Candidatus Omnitrophota bacterium]